MVLTRTLQKVALAGIILVGGAGIFVQTRIRTNFCRQGYYSRPLKILEDYKPGNDILGRPIGIKKVDLADTANNWTDGLQAKVAIPLEGVRMSGTLHAWSARADMADDWTVNKADLEVDGKRWTFYIHPDARDTVTPTQQHQEEPTPSVKDATLNISQPS